MADLSKRDLIAELRRRLGADVADAVRIVKHAADAATHEENRQEGDKDMRSTEASYVARGHAARAEERRRQLVALGALAIRDFGASDRIAPGALVELQSEEGARWVLLLPAAGGDKLDGAGQMVHVITPSSPLGAALMGQLEGDEVEVRAGSRARVYEIVRVR